MPTHAQAKTTRLLEQLSEAKLEAMNKFHEDDYSRGVTRESFIWDVRDHSRGFLSSLLSYNDAVFTDADFPIILINCARGLAASQPSRNGQVPNPFAPHAVPGLALKSLSDHSVG